MSVVPSSLPLLHSWALGAFGGGGHARRHDGGRRIRRPIPRELPLPSPITSDDRNSLSLQPGRAASHPRVGGPLLPPISSGVGLLARMAMVGVGAVAVAMVGDDPSEQRQWR